MQLLIPEKKLSYSYSYDTTATATADSPSLVYSLAVGHHPQSQLLWWLSIVFRCRTALIRASCASAWAEGGNLTEDVDMGGSGAPGQFNMHGTWKWTFGIGRLLEPLQTHGFEIPCPFQGKKSGELLELPSPTRGISVISDRLPETWTQPSRARAKPHFRSIPSGLGRGPASDLPLMPPRDSHRNILLQQHDPTTHQPKDLPDMTGVFCCKVPQKRCFRDDFGDLWRFQILWEEVLGAPRPMGCRGLAGGLSPPQHAPGSTGTPPAPKRTARSRVSELVSICVYIFGVFFKNPHTSIL